MTLQPFTAALLDWYAQHARDLPWRHSPDPYAVLVSELMLQQTRVETVIPYYQRWMQRFPDLGTLARASLQDVLSAWEGLGYYSRARSLHRLAQQVAASGGELPHTAQELERLPGVGRYTAGAVASIAFDQDMPALDGNVRRVLARVFNVDVPGRSPAGERRLWHLAGACLPPGRAGDYNQALMDLGAQVCTPRSPLCLECPVRTWCEASRLGIQDSRPVSLPKPAIPHITVTAAVICNGPKVLITQRPHNGLLGGLWEYPGGKQQDDEDLPACLRREILEELDAGIDVGEPLGIYHHAYTHFRVTLHAFRCRLLPGVTPRPVQVVDLRWVAKTELDDYPMGKIDRQISNHLKT